MSTPQNPVVEQHSATIKVRSIFSLNGQIVRESDDSSEIELPRMDPAAPICTVSIDKSVTKNLGNYNSFKVSAFCSTPCYLDDGQIAAAQTFASTQVDNHIKMVMAEEGLN